MKKKLSYAVLLFISLNLLGCSSGIDPEETQKKIDDAEWKITYDFDEKIAYQYIDIEVSKDSKFDLGESSTGDTFDVIFEKDIKPNNYSIIHEGGKELTVVVPIKGTNNVYSCLRYNLTDNKPTKDTDEGQCNEESLKILADVKTERDKILSDHNLTLDELKAWGEWYMESKK